MATRWTVFIAAALLLLAAAESCLARAAEVSAPDTAARETLCGDAAADGENGRAAVSSAGDRMPKLVVSRSRHGLRLCPAATPLLRPSVLRESSHDINPTRSCGGIDSSLFSLHCRLTL